MLGIRLDAALEEQLEQVARRLRRTKSDIAREAVRLYVRNHDAAYLAEAQRQSLLARAQDDPEIVDLLDEYAHRLADRS